MAFKAVHYVIYFFLPFSAAKVLSHVAASAVGGWPVVVGLTFQSAAFP